MKWTACSDVASVLETVGHVLHMNYYNDVISIILTHTTHWNMNVQVETVTHSVLPQQDTIIGTILIYVCEIYF